MGQTLTELAQTLKSADKKVQLIYAFNGVGKTRLSRELQELVDPKEERQAAAENGEERPPIKFLYYNAYTEDLFSWDNDLYLDSDRRLIITPNEFTEFALGFLKDEGQDGNIATNFQRYTSQSITPKISDDFSKVTFSIRRGGDSIDNVEVSKGEESNFIWCVFYSFLEQIVEILNESEPDEEVVRKFSELKYIFIDDPVSSLDDNHLIELAVNIAELVKKSPSTWNYVVTTHNPLFYNVLHNEFENDDDRYGYDRRRHSTKMRLEKLDDGTFSIIKSNDSPFSYHLFLLGELEKAVELGNIQKYHFNFLRNILEKTSTFLGYKKWKKLLPEGERKEYYNRIINLYSHSKHSGEDVSVVDEVDKIAIAELVEILKTVYHFREV